MRYQYIIMFKEITLLYPFEIEDVSIYTLIPVKYTVNMDNLDELINLLERSPGKEYFDGHFTKDELTFLKDYYDKIDDAHINPPKRLTKKKLKAVQDECAMQKAYLKKNIFDVKKKIKRRSIVYGFNVFEGVKKVGTDTYEVYGYS